MTVAAALKQQLLDLPLQDRAELAQYLIESLQGPEVEVSTEPWAVELQRRVDTIRQHVANGEPAQAVMDRLRRKHS